MRQMKLNEHYLSEDIWTASDELVNLQKACINVLENALNGQFTDREKFIQEIEQASKMLMTLNNKKVSQDKKYSELDRSDWF